MSIGDAMDRVVEGGLPLRFTAYDGSSAGPPDAEVGIHLRHRARPGLPDDRTRRPRPGPGLRQRRPRPLGRPPRRPLRRARRCSRTTPTSGCPRPRRRVTIARGLGPVPPAPAGPAAAGAPAALAPGGRGPAALDDARRRGDLPPLRRLQPLLRDGPRAVDGLHLRALRDPRGDARGGPGREVRPGLPQARPAARRAAARRRAAAGARWSATRPASTACRRSA